jgi:hypothetical protein
MNTAPARSSTFFAFAVMLAAALSPVANAANWYMDAAAVGSHNGTSWTNAWTSFAQIAQASLAGGDVVWIKGGTYNERFTIAKSGTSATARISYIGTGSTKPILYGINGGTYDYIAIVNLEIRQTSTAQGYSAIYLGGSDGWLIQDNYIHDTYLSGVDNSSGSLNSYNVIRHNAFANLGSIGGGSGGGGSVVAVDLIGHHNLVEYNSVTHSMDRIHFYGTGNVARNNYFGPTDSNLYPLSVPYPQHVDGFQSWDGVSPLIQFLWERNYDADNTDSVGATNAHGMIIQDYGTNGFNWVTIRFNLLIRPGGGAYAFRNVSRVYGYNNTAIAIYRGSPSSYNNVVGYESAGAPDLSDWRNNAFCYSPKCLDAVFTLGPLTNFTSDYNFAYNTGPLPSATHNLASVSPLFSDGTGVAGHDDYTLQSGSPLRAAAGAVTTASAAGSSSTSLTVADSKRLFDGWGIADADFIKIGSGSYVQISAINYTTNVVTLTSARSWNSGDGVYVKGSEDVGALPYSYAKAVSITNTTPAIGAGANTLSATVANPDAVRKVEFLVDGLPVGTVYAAPYSVAYTSDGNSHTVTARAYAMWASATPAVDAVGTGAVVPPSNAKTSAIVQ